VNLTLGEVAELPLPAALFGADDHLVASTPEWTGSAPGAVTLRVRGHRLVVGTERASSDREDLVALLLDSLDAASRHALDGSSLQVRMLATALRLLAGRVVERRRELRPCRALRQRRRARANRPRGDH